jgi:short-subunit dehydrogenase
MELTGKKILITGSTDGLGKELASTFISMGAEVTVHGRSKEKVEAVRNAIGAHNGIVSDFNVPEGITEAFSGIAELDILINNAGVWSEGDTVAVSPEKIIELTNVNITAHMLVTRALLPTLLLSKFGQVLNVVSVAGIEIPFDYYHTIYSGVKFGMQGFSEALAKEFFNKNLRVMGFYPGGMETDLFTKAGLEYEPHEPWMFETKESVEAITFMLTRSPKINVKRLDLINHQMA